MLSVRRSSLLVSMSGANRVSGHRKGRGYIGTPSQMGTGFRSQDRLITRSRTRCWAIIGGPRTGCLVKSRWQDVAARGDHKPEQGSCRPCDPWVGDLLQVSPL